MANSNLDELELLLLDLDGRQSMPPPSRNAKSSSVNYGELDNIISELGDRPTPQTGSYAVSRPMQQQSQQQYNPPQQQYSAPQRSDNRDTIDNLDDLLRGLEGDRSSLNIIQNHNNKTNHYQGGGNSHINHSPTSNRVSVNNNYNNNYNNNFNNNPSTNRVSIMQHNNNVPFNSSSPKAGGAPANSGANQKVYVSKPPQVRPVDGDDLTQLIGRLTDNSAPATTSPSARGSCGSCGRPILGESISALGQIFHPEHFACGNCREPIGTNNFFEQDGVPHCERCYQQLLCARCAHCEEPILDKCVTALGRKWHLHHFICTQCLSPFPGGTYFERDQRPYCESCFSGAFNPRCGGCNQPIKGEITNALGQSWHPEHFVCQYCQKAFTGSFYEFAGKPYCDLHYHQQTGSLCAGCSKAITGKCVNALDKKWHPEHFICAFCMNPLVGGNFTENNNKAYCKGCHGKLFG